MTETAVMDKFQEVKSAMIDVRKAYRLLWLYHRRVIDTCEKIISYFDVKHYATYIPNKPGNISYHPLNGRILDFLPMQDMRILFLNNESKSEAPNDFPYAGDYLLEIKIIADTGRDEFCNDDVDPTTFENVEKSQTKLIFYLFVNLKTRKEQTNWFYSIWNNVEYPDHNTVKDNDKIVHDILSYGYEFNFEDLFDEDLIDNCVNTFKKNVKEKISIVDLK
jgi:hypothetical protein